MESSSPKVDNFEITTSLRNDSLLRKLDTGNLLDIGVPALSQFYMLPRHQTRMLAAAKAFSWLAICRTQISCLKEQIHAHLLSTYGDENFGEPVKIRITLSSTTKLGITSTKVAPVSYKCLFPRSLSDLLSAADTGSCPTFRVVFSPMPLAASPFTQFKTTNRAHYDDIRSQTLPLVKRSGRKLDELPIEVLLANHVGEIMEGTFTTPYFFCGGQWITPSAECGGNLGTTRQYALDQSLCEEGIVRRATVAKGDKVVLSNGVKGFGWGVVEELEDSINQEP